MGGGAAVRVVEVPILALMHLLLALVAATPAPDVKEIVARSVANNQADWKAAPQFTYTEHDVAVKGGKKTTHTYRVLMIDGSPYNEPIAVNGQELSPAAKRAEDQKRQREMERRLHESPEARSRRIAEYETGRRQDHALMQEMIAGFSFRLDGMETVNGRNCYKVDASPNPAYVPKSRETQVLKGMRGTLWIDSQAYQWVKVHASVFRPVAFGLFIAHVEPGTEFLLEEAPVEGSLWMPSHFETKVNAKVLFFGYKTQELETYSNYRRANKPGERVSK